MDKNKINSTAADQIIIDHSLAQVAYSKINAIWEKRLKFCKSLSPRSYYRACKKRTSAIYRLFDNWEWKGGKLYLHNKFKLACKTEQKAWVDLINSSISPYRRFSVWEKNLLRLDNPSNRDLTKQDYKQAWRLIRLARQEKSFSIEDLNTAAELLTRE